LILHKLRMKNFRQFRGVQELDFASDARQDGKNVTVIFGKNGRGKTGIFRAIIFCLFGERQLTQDEEITDKEIYLVNLAELEMMALEKKAVEAFVSLNFEHKGEHYEIRRSIKGIMDGNERFEQIDKIVLTHIKADGNATVIKDSEEIKKIINNILDKSIKEYFLFDGEKIQRLTLASIEQRREVAKGIRNLLNVDALEKAIRSTQKLKKDLNTELSKKAKGEFGKVIHQLNVAEEKIAQLKYNLQNKEDEYFRADIEKKQINKQLEECEEIVHLLRERTEAEEKLGYQEEQSKNLLTEMKSRTGKASLLLVSEVVDSIFGAIDQKKQKGEIPSEIRKDFIDKVLRERRCICGRGILPGSEAFKEIILWKNKTCDVELESSALEIWRSLSGIRSHREDLSTAIDVYLQKYAICRNEISILQSRIEDINKQIGLSERQDAAEFENIRDNIEKKQIALKAQIYKIKEELDVAEAEHRQLLERRQLLEKEENVKNELMQRANLTEETCNALQEIYDEFTEEIKSKIAEEANKYFVQLLDAEGRKTLRRILVNSDYSLQILDRWDKPFLANISAGQRQIMSIAFIAALAKAAASGLILEMPLFMDTPFGRLSGEHRKNLIEHIPNYCAQWILLSTDTEFSKQEAGILRKTGRWGKFYELKAEGAGTTIIQQREIVDHSLLIEKAEEVI
jgi:DNA sulfur modification protein DndD